MWCRVRADKEHLYVCRCALLFEPEWDEWTAQDCSLPRSQSAGSYILHAEAPSPLPPMQTKRGVKLLNEVPDNLPPIAGDAGRIIQVCGVKPTLEAFL